MCSSYYFAMTILLLVGVSAGRIIVLDMADDLPIEWTTDCPYGETLRELQIKCEVPNQPSGSRGFWGNCGSRNCTFNFKTPETDESNQLQPINFKIFSYISGQGSTISVVDGVRLLHVTPFSFWDQEKVDVSFVREIESLKVTLTSPFEGSNPNSQFVIIDRIEVEIGERNKRPTEPPPGPEPDSATLAFNNILLILACVTGIFLKL